jgi:hypothetical protein
MATHPRMDKRKSASAKMQVRSVLRHGSRTDRCATRRFAHQAAALAPLGPARSVALRRARLRSPAKGHSSPRSPGSVASALTVVRTSAGRRSGRVCQSRSNVCQSLRACCSRIARASHCPSRNTAAVVPCSSHGPRGAAATTKRRSPGASIEISLSKSQSTPASERVNFSSNACVTSPFVSTTRSTPPTLPVQSGREKARSIFSEPRTAHTTLAAALRAGRPRAAHASRTGRCLPGCQPLPRRGPRGAPCRSPFDCLCSRAEGTAPKSLTGSRPAQAST